MTIESTQPVQGDPRTAAQIADDAPTLQEAARTFLGGLCTSAGWMAARLELRERMASIWSVQPGGSLSELRATAVQRRTGDGLWKLIEGVPAPKWTSVVIDGSRTTIVFPLVAAGRLIGAVEAFPAGPAEPSQQLLESIAGICAQVAPVLARKPEPGPDPLQPAMDPITGLPMRAGFLRRLAQAMARNGAGGRSTVAVIHFDLDRFKWINDGIGRDGGDEVLRRVAQRLSSAARPGSLVARVGSDEFALLLERVVDPGQVLRTSDRLQRSLAEPHAICGREVYATAATGVAFGGSGPERAEDILSNAETATAQARARGPNVRVLFESSMQREAAAQLQLDSDLRKAVSRDEIIVCYQPIVSLRTGEVAGFEALARWKHPERGFIPPSTFIPLAEESGLIGALGLSVLRDACQGMRLLQVGHRQPLKLGVNLSAPQLFQPGLVDAIAKILGDTAMDPTQLHLEVTESVLVDRVDAALEVLHALKRLRVRIAMDDFGTGYSSLSYLHALPIDVLKIDRSFISVLETPGDKSERILHAILQLAIGAGVEAVAEGVETAAQADALRRLGCEFAQGYHFARPSSLDDACALLQKRTA